MEYRSSIEYQQQTTLSSEINMNFNIAHDTWQKNCLLQVLHSNIQAL